MSFVCEEAQKNIPQNLFISGYPSKNVKTIPCHGTNQYIPGKIILLYDTLLLCMCMYLKITRMKIWP